MIEEFYEGFEGEPDVWVVIGRDRQYPEQGLHCWSGHYDEIMQNIQSNDDGQWGALASAFHSDSGWYDEPAWQLPVVLAGKKELETVERIKLDNGTDAVLIGLLALFETALSLNLHVFVSYDPDITVLPAFTTRTLTCACPHCEQPIETYLDDSSLTHQSWRSISLATACSHYIYSSLRVDPQRQDIIVEHELDRKVTIPLGLPSINHAILEATGRQAVLSRLSMQPGYQVYIISYFDEQGLDEQSRLRLLPPGENPNDFLYGPKSRPSAADVNYAQAIDAGKMLWYDDEKQVLVKGESDRCDFARPKLAIWQDLRLEAGKYVATASDDGYHYELQVERAPLAKPTLKASDFEYIGLAWRLPRAFNHKLFGPVSVECSDLFAQTSSVSATMLKQAEALLEQIDVKQAELLEILMANYQQFLGEEEAMLADDAIPKRFIDKGLSAELTTENIQEALLDFGIYISDEIVGFQFQTKWWPHDRLVIALANDQFEEPLMMPNKINVLSPSYLCDNSLADRIAIIGKDLSRSTWDGDDAPADLKIEELVATRLFYYMIYDRNFRGEFWSQRVLDQYGENIPIDDIKFMVDQFERADFLELEFIVPYAKASPLPTSIIQRVLRLLGASISPTELETAINAGREIQPEVIIANGSSSGEYLAIDTWAGRSKVCNFIKVYGRSRRHNFATLEALMHQWASEHKRPVWLVNPPMTIYLDRLDEVSIVEL